MGGRAAVVHFSASTHFELRRTTYFCFKGPLLVLIATDLGEVVKDKIFSLVNNEVSRVSFILKKIPNLENVNNESEKVQSLGQFNMRARRDLRPRSLAVEGWNP